MHVLCINNVIVTFKDYTLALIKQPNVDGNRTEWWLLFNAPSYARQLILQAWPEDREKEALNGFADLHSGFREIGRDGSVMICVGDAATDARADIMENTDALGQGRGYTVYRYPDACERGMGKAPVDEAAQAVDELEIKE